MAEKDEYHAISVKVTFQFVNDPINARRAYRDIRKAIDEGMRLANDGVTGPGEGTIKLEVMDASGHNVRNLISDNWDI